MNVSAQARQMMVLNRDRAKNRQMSLLSRAATEAGDEGLQYWGHIQGKMQPTFRVDYERSHVTMS